jgi:hypothetical protein
LVGFVPEKGVRSTQGRYRPLLFESLAQAPAGQDLPFADLTGCFVRSDRNAVCKEGLSLSGAFDEGGTSNGEDHRHGR